MWTFVEYRLHYTFSLYFDYLGRLNNKPTKSSKTAWLSKSSQPIPQCSLIVSRFSQLICSGGGRKSNSWPRLSKLQSHNFNPESPLLHLRNFSLFPCSSMLPPAERKSHVGQMSKLLSTEGLQKDQHRKWNNGLKEQYKPARPICPL